MDRVAERVLDGRDLGGDAAVHRVDVGLRAPPRTPRSSRGGPRRRWPRSRRCARCRSGTGSRCRPRRAPRRRRRRRRATAVAAAPRSTTSPQNSWPKTSGGWMRPCAHLSQSWMWRSVPQMLAALTLIRTSRSPRSGTGTWLHLGAGSGRGLDDRGHGAGHRSGDRIEPNSTLFLLSNRCDAGHTAATTVRGATTVVWSRWPASARAWPRCS